MIEKRRLSENRPARTSSMMFMVCHPAGGAESSSGDADSRSVFVVAACCSDLLSLIAMALGSVGGDSVFSFAMFSEVAMMMILTVDGVCVKLASGICGLYTYVQTFPPGIRRTPWLCLPEKPNHYLCSCLWLERLCVFMMFFILRHTHRNR